MMYSNSIQTPLSCSRAVTPCVWRRHGRVIPLRLPSPCRAAAGAAAAGSFPEGPGGWGLPGHAASNGGAAAAGDRRSVHQHAGGHTAGSSSNNNNSTSSSTPGGAGDGAGGSGSGSAAPGLEGLGVRPAERSAAQRYKDELHTLNVAIIVNVLIFGAKLWVHAISGSSAMLAEALHSVADVLNQMLLRVGLLKAQKGPTELHPYGYARDRFIWSLISAVGIFFLGAGASFIHGLHTLMEHRELEHMAWNYLVLGVSGILEGYSLWVATRVVVAGAASRKMGLLQYIKSGLDPTTVAVMMEDGGAVLGLVIAGVCTALAQATGNAMWDAAGSILVGCLLGGIATFLVQKNRQLLIGRSMAPQDAAAVQALLQSDPVVAYVKDTMTEEVGSGMFRFKAEVAWNGDAVVQRYLDRCGRERLMGQLQAAAAAGDRSALEALLRAYGRDLVSAVGAEVDRIEGNIQRMNPGIMWVDLETDRGRGGDGVRRSGGGGGGGSSGGSSGGGSGGAGAAGAGVDTGATVLGVVGMGGAERAGASAAGPAGRNEAMASDAVLLVEGGYSCSIPAIELHPPPQPPPQAPAAQSPFAGEGRLPQGQQQRGQVQVQLAPNMQQESWRWQQLDGSQGQVAAAALAGAPAAAGSAVPPVSALQAGESSSTLRELDLSGEPWRGAAGPGTVMAAGAGAGGGAVVAGGRGAGAGGPLRA